MMPRESLFAIRRSVEKREREREREKRPIKRTRFRREAEDKRTRKISRHPAVVRIRTKGGNKQRVDERLCRNSQDQLQFGLEQLRQSPFCGWMKGDWRAVEQAALLYGLYSVYTAYR
jgi:hypothetical protein